MLKFIDIVGIINLTNNANYNYWFVAVTAAVDTDSILVFFGLKTSEILSDLNQIWSGPRAVQTHWLNFFRDWEIFGN